MNNLNSIPNFREDRQIKNLILSRLDQINIVYSQVSFAQHLKSILRKGESGTDPYFWTNKELLSGIEKYIKVLEEDPPQFSYLET